jgi:nicotinamide mononucleotide (NMN) deamidase PncC
MKNPHAFLIGAMASTTAACAVAAAALAPVDGNRTQSVAGFVWFGGMAAAAAALTAAAIADAATPAARRR